MNSAEHNQQELEHQEYLYKEIYNAMMELNYPKMTFEEFRIELSMMICEKLLNQNSNRR